MRAIISLLLISTMVFGVIEAVSVQKSLKIFEGERGDCVGESQQCADWSGPYCCKGYYCTCQYFPKCICVNDNGK
uniref:U3-agatoxin-Ao1h n=1 Tax=Agelena orientalis TaxID=293813 RepID=T4G1H_AGEOR|nr:RecName: Full=U3-agatoxin-Ao1h; Short=U3-AGTX-Ao1h; AltName: Full=Mu-2Aaga_09; Flags: Precursor [Agelena orientalis]AAU87893.1 toxin-like structure mu-2Aaga_09 precursor [Agelena orientalis]